MADSAASRDYKCRLRLFGTFHLEKDGVPVNVTGRKGRALLAYLVLFPEPHAREQLAALFWENGTDADARLSLRVNLTRLKKIIPELLLADMDTVQLNPDANLWVDVSEFKQQLETSKDETTRASSSAMQRNSFLEHVTLLYTGDLLSEFYDDWILQEREHLRQLYVDALLDLVQHHRAQSEYRRAIEAAQKVLQTDRANERAHQHLMFCFVASGDRNAALAQYAECKRLLREELSVAPSRDTTALYLWIKQAPSESNSPAARITNLPILPTSFIGRQRELIQIKQLLGAARLLTLTGMGGSGKTRLAVQVGTEWLDHYADGVWWVELARLNNGEHLLDTVAHTLGVKEKQGEPLTTTVVQSLREKHVLLILDNCEHLIRVTQQLVAALLAQCPHLQILATSRERLGTAEEIVYRIPTLQVPRSAITASSRELLDYEAVQLFVERAQATTSEFQYADTTADIVAKIVRRLDGIPLAIELAAARARMMPVAEIERELDHRFRLLQGGAPSRTPHHLTLQMLIDWSYNLLSEPEKMLLRRMAVFRGGASLDAIVAVVHGTVENSVSQPTDAVATFSIGPSQLITLLIRELAERSLVVVEPHLDSPRYGLLETIREYATERLHEQEEQISIQERHLGYFTAMAEENFHPPWERQDVKQFARMEMEHDNLRAALEFALTCRNAEMALPLSGALGVFWVLQSHTREADRWYARVLELADQSVQALSARVFSFAGAVKWVKSDFA